MTTATEYMGMGMHWWTGVVEDRKDPLKLGRVRVRILGLHSEQRIEDDINGVGIPVDQLPWAFPLQGVNSAGMNGIGQSPLGFVEGSWVVGISRDGDAYQDLIVLGSLGGIPANAPIQDGFNDPNLVYPKVDFLDEPDTNRLARNEKIEETVVQTKLDSVNKGIPKAQSGEWDEPDTPYAPEYPFNHVNESESGHISEVDDTPEHERLHTYHKAGTFEEIHPDGSKVTKIVGDDWNIYLKDKSVYIAGNLSITIDGNAELYVKGDSDLKVDGNVVQNIAGNVTQNISGNVSQDIDGNVSEHVAGSADINIDGNTTVVCPNTHVTGDVTTKGNVTLDEGSGKIVTTEHICAFTGAPHIDGSSSCKAKK